MKDLEAAIYQMPGIRRFVQSLVDDLAQGRNLLVAVPRVMTGELLWDAVRGELWHRQMDVGEVELGGGALGRSVGEVLCEALGISGTPWDKVEAPERALVGDHLPAVIYLGGLNRLDEAAAGPWLAFLNRWGRLSLALTNEGRRPPAFCAYVSQTGLLGSPPPNDVRASMRWWWGVISCLEIRMACRLTGDEGKGEAAVIWRENILPTLVGGDLELAAFVSEALYGDEIELRERLVAFGHHRGWAEEPIRALLAEGQFGGIGSSDGSGILAVPDRWRTLWSLGAIQDTREHGVEVSPAALALVDRWEAVRHRLWRGQATLLLPLLDWIRLRVCGQLTRIHGRDWPLRWRIPEDVEEARAAAANSFACQFGHLELLLRTCRALSSHRQWVPLVAECRWIRNELAHYRPISFAAFRRLWDMIAETSGFGAGSMT